MARDTTPLQTNDLASLIIIASGKYFVEVDLNKKAIAERG